MAGIFTKRIWQLYHHLVRPMLLNSEMNVTRVDEPVMIRAMFIYLSCIANQQPFQQAHSDLETFSLKRILVLTRNFCFFLYIKIAVMSPL